MYFIKFSKLFIFIFIFLILIVLKKENSPLRVRKKFLFLTKNLPTGMLDTNATIVENTSQKGDISPLICVYDISVGFVCSDRGKVQNLISSDNLLPILFTSPGVHSFCNLLSNVTINLRHNDSSLCSSTF